MENIKIHKKLVCTVEKNVEILVCRTINLFLTEVYVSHAYPFSKKVKHTNKMLNHISTLLSLLVSEIQI